jgi:hypothetical protein
MVFRQLFDPQSSTYTYLLGDRASAAADRVQILDVREPNGLHSVLVRA